MKCPECKKSMGWIEGLLADGTHDTTLGRFFCDGCRLWMKPMESRAIRKGRKIAKELPHDIPAMDKRITKYSMAIQIGILRAKQHD